MVVLCVLRLQLQDPVVVDDDFGEERVKCFVVPKLVQSLHEVNISLPELNPIAFIHLASQRACAYLQEILKNTNRKKASESLCTANSTMNRFLMCITYYYYAAKLIFM